MSNFVVNPYLLVVKVSTTYTQTFIPNDQDIGSGETVGEMAMNDSSLLYGFAITDAQFYPFNPNENTGTLTCGVWNAAGSLLHTFWTKDMTELPTAHESAVVTTETSTPYTSAIAVGDTIGCTAGSGCKLATYQINDSKFDGTNSKLSYNFSSVTGDAAFSITTITA